MGRVDEGTFASIAVGSGLTALVWAQLALGRRRERRAALALADGGLAVPVSLHPVIDAEICLGSLACLKACPEGDILGVIDGAARLVNASNCVGHGRCATACPVNAIKLVFGTAERGVDLPEVDGCFESSRPGVHVVGELAGMGLVANAVAQGAQCAGYLADRLEGQPSGGEAHPDVVVIGAGPAGVSCALGLRRRGLSVRILDRGRLGDARAYQLDPDRPLVLSGPLELPGAGRLRRLPPGKGLLELFEKALAEAGQRVDEGVPVTGLTGGDGAFTVETAQGPVGARKVVLATGRGPGRGPGPGQEPPGGEGPLRFLEAMGVGLRRLHGEAPVVARPGQGLARTLSREHAVRRTWWRWMAILGAATLLLLLGLWWVGRDYYPLSGRMRLQSPLHPRLKPASSLGLTIGVAATAVMLTNFLYALRKRWGALAGVGSLANWLDLHVFVGAMSPVVIGFHAAFQSNNRVATITYASLGIVVGTGLVGRYFYALVPGREGQALALAELLGKLERLRERVGPLLAGARDRAPLEALLAAASAPPSQAPLAAQLALAAAEAIAFRLRLSAALHLLPTEDRAVFRDGLLRLHRLRAQAGLFRGIKRLMRVWRSLHASLAVLLVGALTAHVAVSVYLGYFPHGR